MIRVGGPRNLSPLPEIAIPGLIHVPDPIYICENTEKPSVNYFQSAFVRGHMNVSFYPQLRRRLFLGVAISELTVMSSEALKLRIASLDGTPCL